MFSEILKFRRKIVGLGLPAMVSTGTLAIWGVFAIFIARALPEEAYAAYALARSIQLFGALLGGGFVIQAVIKFSSEGDSSRERQLANTGMLVSAALAVLSALLLLSGSGILRSFYSDIDLQGIPEILALFILVSTASQLPRSLLVARHRLNQVMISDIISFLLRVGFVGSYMLSGALNSPIQIFWAMIIGNAAALVVNIWLARDLISLRLGIGPGHVKLLLGFSIFTLGTSLANFVYTRTDILLLGKLAEPLQVSAYGVCRTLTGFVQNLITASNMILLPLISRMWMRGQRKEILRRALSGILLVELIQLPIVLAFIFMPRGLLHFIYNGRYDHAWPVLLILGALTIIRPLGSIFSTMSLGMGKPSYSLYSVLVSAGVNVGLNLVLIPRYGAAGAAVATAVAVILGTIAIMLLTIRHWRSNLN